MADVLLLVFSVLGIVWMIFTVVVLVSVLRVSLEALLYYQRINADQRRADLAAAKKAAPWAYE